MYGPTRLGKYQQALFRILAARGTSTAKDLKKSLDAFYKKDENDQDSDMEDDRQTLNEVLGVIREKIEPLGLTLKNIQTKKRRRNKDETMVLWAITTSDNSDAVNMKFGSPFSEEENCFLNSIMNTLKDDEEGVARGSLLACREDVPADLRKKLSDQKASYAIEKFVDQNLLKRTGRAKKYVLGDMGKITIKDNAIGVKVKTKSKVKTKAKKHAEEQQDSDTETESED